MIYRHTQQQVDDYFEHIGINQSGLKVLLSQGIQMYMLMKEELGKQPDEYYYEEKKHFVLGNAVDTKITMGEEVYKDKYFESELIKKPTPVVMSILKRVFDTVSIHDDMIEDTDSAYDLKSYPEEVYNACNEHEYSMNRRKPDFRGDTRIETILKGSGKLYWEELIKSVGKQMLSAEEALIVNNIVMSLLTHPHTKWIFEDGTSDRDTIYQFPMYWEYEDEDCKGLVDIIYINHDRRLIMPINLKTIGEPVLRFNRSVNKRRYDIGEVFYLSGLEKCINQLSAIVNKDLWDYTIANPAFVVESTVIQGTPMIYVLTNKALEIGRVGNGDDKLGWTQAFDLYKSWKAVDFNLTERFKATNGIVWIDEFFEYDQIF